MNRIRVSAVSKVWAHLLAGLFLFAAFSGVSTFAAPASSARNSSDLDVISKNLRADGLLGAGDAQTIDVRMARYGVPGVAIALIRDGDVAEARGFGVLQAGGGQPVTADTLFSVGSVSKVAAATLALKLSATGRLGVDEDVRQYLTSWQLPAGAPPEPVTLRQIFAHTAGFNIHGFGDFEPGARLPSAVDTLNGAPPARHEPLRFLSYPGDRYRYSGGGYTLAQLVMTDVSQQTFPTLAREMLFEPLDMQRSSFTNPLPETVTNVAKAHDRRGRPVALPRGYQAMPEMAASGLWTSANELGRLVGALIESYRKPGGYLPQQVARDMMTPVAPSEHGIGPRIDLSGPTLIFHHGGANDSYRAWIEGDLETGNGLVVLTNGTNGDDLFGEIRRAVSALDEQNR